MPDHRSSEPRAGVVLVLGFLLLAVGCGPDDPGFPDGTYLAGDAAALAVLLNQVETLAGTPAARVAAMAKERIAPCDWVESRCPPGENCEWLERIECIQRPRSFGGAAQADRGTQWVLSHSLQDGGHLVLRGTTMEDGAVRVVGEVPRRDDGSPLAPLMPASAPAGPPLLSSADCLLHLKVRPDRGLDFDVLVPPGAKQERFVRLQSELLVAASLEGTWEVAVYTPREGRLFPAAALALEVTNRALAMQAMESFLEEIMHIWPVRRSPFSLGESSGSCLSNLNVMPELAPCYVATQRVLVVGWNAESLTTALGEDGTPAAEEKNLDSPSRLTLYLDRFPEADRRLAQTWNPGWDLPPLAYPWRELVLEGHLEGDVYRLSLELPAGASP